MWIYSNNQDQVIWLAESKKWVWHLNLFSRTRVKGGNLHAFVIYTWQFAYRLFGLWQENRECWLTVHSCRQEKYLDKKTCYGYLTHCILNRLSHTIYWKSPISIFGAPSYEIYIFLEKNGKTINFANSGEPDQMPRSVASDLGLHCLLITLLRVSQLQWECFCREIRKIPTQFG